MHEPLVHTFVIFCTLRVIYKHMFNAFLFYHALKWHLVLFKLSSLTSVNLALLFFRALLVELVSDRLLRLQSPAPPLLQGIVRPSLFRRLRFCLSTPRELFSAED